LKILIANASYKPNIVAGAEKVVETLAENLVERGHEIVIVTTQPRGGEQVRVLSGVKVYYVPVTNVYRPFAGLRPSAAQRALWHLIDTYNPFMRRAFGRILEAEKPDVVNTHNVPGFSTSIMAETRARGLPLVHTLHDQYLLCPKGTMFKNEQNCVRQCRDCRLYSGPRRRVSQSVNVAVGVSRFILERHRQLGFFARSEARVIYNGFSAKHPGASALRNERRPFRFGFLGQIRSTKGLHRLIDAFQAECANESELWIAGAGDEQYEAVLKSRTESLPSVRWLGFVKASDLLEQVDVLVVPSLWNDTAPLVVLEAQGHGVPVLGSNRGGIPELIAPEGGWVFDPDFPDALRKALRACIAQRDDLRKMGAAARRHAELFDLERFIKGYMDVFVQLT
jgi:glycosyltransferase involved in cell wall biosynthesis